MSKLHIDRKSFSRSSPDLLHFFRGHLTQTPVAFWAFLIFLSSQVTAQPWDVPYIPTPYHVVDEMLDIADVGPGDYVIDLGSGDGRIVIAAILRGAYGHGIDIDPVRIREARQNAKDAKLENRVLFVEGNIFDADISRAGVITMYLLNSINIQLRPTLLKSLRPGSRVVSYVFDMNEWKPDEVITLENGLIYLWIIPARVAGNWKWKAGNKEFSMHVKQEFQEIELKVAAGNTPLTIDKPFLSGERISFLAAHPSNGDVYLYSGHVDGNTINGTVQIHNINTKSVENWTATME